MSGFQSVIECVNCFCCCCCLLIAPLTCYIQYYTLLTEKRKKARSVLNPTYNALFFIIVLSFYATFLFLLKKKDTNVWTVDKKKNYFIELSASTPK